MMNIIKKTGIFLLLLALVVLTASLLVVKYEFRESHLDQLDMSKGQKTAFDLSTKKYQGKVYFSKFAYLEDLSAGFSGANHLIEYSFSISDRHIDRLVNRSLTDAGVDYNPAYAGDLFPAGNDISSARIRGIKDYTGWISEREYSSVEKFKEDLKSSIGKYNRSIISERGFGDEKIKELKFRILKETHTGFTAKHPLLMFLFTFGMAVIGSLMYIISKYRKVRPGIKNDYVFRHSLTGRGWMALVLGIYLIGFYILLYWYAYYIAEWALILDPVSQWIAGRDASQWFFYGFVYTMAILIMGVKFMIKYRHSRHHKIRTVSVMFFQLIFAFSIPQILYVLNLPEVDLKNIWPLDYYFFFEWRINEYLEAGTLGIFMFGWGIALIILGVPLITYFLGKRWYCSWVCGCGGLAETAGDPFRHLSDNSLRAWQIERYLVHGVLVFAVAMTAWVLYTFFSGDSVFLGVNSYELRKVYGFAIGAVFAGVIGVGFYTFMGNRPWCRFGCPLAAYLGIVQRFKSRFRISTNGGQCMSCGNCSTYCEMGIDVRAYAQKGQNIIRASCVGCGICAAVCPRGVLRLENKKEKGRFNKPVLLGNDNYIKQSKGSKAH